MDHKRFISELQKRTGLDRRVLDKLLKSTELVLSDQAICNNKIDLEVLGSFEPHKRMEFIYKNKSTGERILYPPRISVRYIPSAALLKAVGH